MAEPPPPLLRLPRELRIQILSHLLMQGEVITVSEGAYPKKRRKLNKELARLKDPEWRPPRKHYPDCLRVCKELYLSGIMVFWASNTFVFGDCDVLQRFIDDAHEEAVTCITAIILGEDYHCAGNEVNDYGERALLDNWPHPNWPASMAILTQLPRLKSLDLFVGSLGDNEGMKRRMFRPGIHYSDVFRPPGVSGVADQRTDLCTTVSDRLDVVRPPWFDQAGVQASGSLYLRDLVLSDIPDVVFNNLISLKIRYYMPSVVCWTTREVLPYAKDLRAGAWREWPDYNPEQWSGEQAVRMKRWMEARAAVYWDHSLREQLLERWPPDPNHLNSEWTAKMANDSQQWCTWAREWLRIRDFNHQTLQPQPWAPRSYEELFGPPDEVEGDPADASWAWHKKRKAAEMSK